MSNQVLMGTYKDRLNKKLEMGDFVLVATARHRMSVGWIYKETKHFLHVCHKEFMVDETKWSDKTRRFEKTGKKITKRDVTQVPIGDADEIIKITKEYYDEFVEQTS